MLKKYNENKDFFKMVITVSLPIMIQQAISNFVSLLDNLMVGQVGTIQMSSVSIANQLMFIFMLTMFGGLAGAGIFTSQFFGKEDAEGVKQTIRYKLYLGLTITAAALFIFYKFGPALIGIYLTGADSAETARTTLAYATEYMHVMMVGFVPMCLAQVFATTLRECGETKLPMRAGVTAIFVNLIFNYLLIFGHFGFPELGIRGAAIATVMSRFVEFGMIYFVAKRNTAKYPFLYKVFSSFRIKGALAKDITIKGLPLLANETLWSLGLSMVTAAYSTRGIEVIASMNIAMTVSNLFNAVFMSMGSATSIIIGHELGAGKTEQAYEDDLKILWFCTALCIGVSIMTAMTSLFVPQLYNTTETVKHMATQLILVQAVCAPLFGFTNVCYFTLRSGGKTFITFLFDSMFVCCITLPAALILTKFTAIYIVVCYLMVNSLDLLKCIVGYVLIKKKIWVNNMVAEG